jgi:hypothetical protein
VLGRRATGGLRRHRRGTVCNIVGTAIMRGIVAILVSPTVITIVEVACIRSIAVGVGLGGDTAGQDLWGRPRALHRAGLCSMLLARLCSPGGGAPALLDATLAHAAAGTHRRPGKDTRALREQGDKVGLDRLDDLGLAPNEDRALVGRQVDINGDGRKLEKQKVPTQTDPPKVSE